MNAILISSITGLCIAGIAYTNLANYSVAIDFVEADLKERLRALRFSSKPIRRWVHTWLGIVATVFVVLWIGLDAVALAAPVAVMAPAPFASVRCGHVVAAVLGGD